MTFAMTARRAFAAAALASGLGLAAAGSASAADFVNWADLTSSNADQGTVDGTIAGIGFNYSGGYYFAQTDGTGTNYWSEGVPAPYTGGAVGNAPVSSDIIALGAGGLKTITFSQAVSNVYLALVSWNGNSGVFNQPFVVVSQGCGHWGCGTFQNVTSTSFDGSGELHGIIEFTGTFTSVSFTDVGEYWHGIQIGIGSVAPPSGAPEPASWALMLGGFGLAGAAMRANRRRLAKVAA